VEKLLAAKEKVDQLERKNIEIGKELAEKAVKLTETFTS